MADRPFLSRWSRLKQEARTQQSGQASERRGSAAPVLEEQAPSAPPPSDAGAGGQAVTARQPQQERERGQEAPVDLSELPDIESLTAESDFSAFMRKGVPKSLQRRALRKLWASDPIFAFQDGLTDYQDDYTDAATVIDGMKSSYQVGRGFLTDAELAENHSVYNASRQARIEAEESERKPGAQKLADDPAAASAPDEAGPVESDQAVEQDGRAAALQPPQEMPAEEGDVVENELKKRTPENESDNRS